MVKCEVLETFAGLYAAGAKGQIIEMTDDEAVGFQSCGLVKIIEKITPPMAYETAKKAVKAEKAVKK